MLSSDQRREKLESLLKRVQTNRPRPGAAQARAAQGPTAEPHAPPAASARSARTAMRAEPAKPPQGTGIETDLVDTENTDSLLDLEFDTGIDDGGMLIDSPPAREEAKAPPARKPSAPPSAGLEEPATLVESVQLVKSPRREVAPAPKAEAAPSPKLAPPSREPAAKKPAAHAPAAAPEQLDDEPEIEVSYGTEEALALQAELGYGDDEGEFSDSDTQVTASDQLTLADMPYQQKPAAAARPAPVEYDDLPAPAPKEAMLDQLLEAPPAPVTPVPTVETPKPSEIEAAAPMPLTQPSIREARVSDRTKLHAKTVEDLGSLAELSLSEETAPVKVEKPPVAEPKVAPPAPRPAPAAAAAAPVAPAAPAAVAPHVVTTLSRAAEEVTRPVSFDVAVAASAKKPSAAPAVAPAAAAPAAAAPAVSPAARPAEPSVHGFASAAIDAKAQVEAFSGEVPAPRPRTLGELIRLALAVGRKS